MTVNLGYALSSEEHPPGDLVRLARRAEATGFEYALISDHFHPWTSRQGQSPFVWGVLGAIAASTERLRVGTGVTCPLIRTHPAVIAHAAATAAALMPGRFFLGVGSGENLNEHITGARWPAPPERLEMLREAIGVIRQLWQGGTQSFDGRHYRLRAARLYTLPEEPPPLVVAAGAEQAALLAGELGDGLVCTSPDAAIVDRFLSGGRETGDPVRGAARPRYGQVTVCVHEDEAAARAEALEWWPTAALGGSLSQEIEQPADFEAAVATVREEDVAERIVCGCDPERHLQAIRAYADAGFDHVYVHQVGPRQDDFFRFYAEQVMPLLAGR